MIEGPPISTRIFVFEDFINGYVNGVISPQFASEKLIKRLKKPKGFTHESAYARLEGQHRYFQDSGELDYSQRSRVRWDDLIICVEKIFEEEGFVPQQGSRISDFRLAPPEEHILIAK